MQFFRFAAVLPQKNKICLTDCKRLQRRLALLSRCTDTTRLGNTASIQDLSLIHILEELIHKAGGIVVGRAAVLAEGDAADRKDIIYLEKLPLFFH